MWRIGQEPRAPRRPRRRGCILSACMHPGPPSSTPILHLQRPTAPVPTVAPAGRGLGTGPPPCPRAPVVLHDFCARVQGQEWNVCPLGLGTALPQGLSPHPRSPFQDPSCGEERYLWCLRDPIELARPRGRRQDTRMAGSGLAYHHCRDLPRGAGQAWLCCRTHKAECSLPTPGRCCQSSFLLRTLTWRLCP